MYRNNQSRRARNGNDENREKIETRSDRLFQPFSCFNSPLFFDQRFTDSTLPILYRPSYPRKEKEREIQTRPREKSVFGREGAGEREGEIKWNAKLNLAYPRLDWNRDGAPR